MKSVLRIALFLVLILASTSYAEEVSPNSGELLVRGIVASTPGTNREFTVTVVSVRAAGASADTILKTRASKTVTLSEQTSYLRRGDKTGSVDDIVGGAEVAVVGRNLGTGKQLPARVVVIYFPEDSPEPSVDASVPKTTNLDPSKPASLMESASVSINSSAFTEWNDPAGLNYQYPRAWMPSGAVGANPIVFQRGNLAFTVRRLPVDSGMDAKSRTMAAISAFKASASKYGLTTSEQAAKAASARGTIVTASGKISDADAAGLIGGKPMKFVGGVIVQAIFIEAPQNSGRDPWVLEAMVIGPEQNSRTIGQVMSQFQSSLRFGIQEVKEAPKFVSPVRAANTVEIMNTMKQIGTAMQVYFTSEDDVVPPNWTALAPYLGGAGSGTMKNITQGWPQWNVGPVQLLQPGKRLSEIGDPSSSAVAVVDGQGFRVILYADGHVNRQQR